MIEGAGKLSDELLRYLQKINDNVTDIRDRVIRIESQDYTYSIRALQAAQDAADKDREKLSMELVTIKTRVAPLFALVTAIVGVVIDVVIRTIVHT